MSGLLGKLIPKKKIRAVDIGPPLNMEHNIHVTKNRETGKLEGLPEDWTKSLNPESSSTQVGNTGTALKSGSAKSCPEEKIHEPSKPSVLDMKVENDEEILKQCRRNSVIHDVN
uniref:CRIB domain-containing protein n=1 Tax=Heliothis virescens TaxID=7102 RepID=A0A2A4JCL5_HELVI